MADLGALTLKFSDLGYKVVATSGFPAFAIHAPAEANGQRAVASWLESTRFPNPMTADAHGYFQGSVLAEGTPVPYAQVRLYYRPTGAQIASMRASATGAFRFDGLPGAVSEYYVLAFDPDGGLMYNLAAFDRIAAVPSFNKTAAPAGLIAGRMGPVGVGFPDASWASVVSLLNFEGTPFSTDFTDNAGRTWTATGQAALNPGQAKHGQTSLFLDGAGDYITAVSGSLHVASADFTVECWVYPIATPGSTMAIAHFNAGSTQGLHIHRNTGGYLVVDNGATGTTAGTITLPLNTWTHIAAVRYSGNIYGYVGGVQALTHAVQTYATATQCQLGRYGVGEGASDFHGFIDGFRVTAGVARYTAGFTPPSVPFVGG